MTTGILLFMVALLADLISVNRKLLEKLQTKIQLLDDSINKKEQTYSSGQKCVN